MLMLCLFDRLLELESCPKTLPFSLFRAMSALVALCRARATASSSLFNSVIRPAFRNFSTGS